MIITNIYYKKIISYLLAESKKESSEWRNYYYGESDYDWNYQEFIDAIEDRLNDYGLEASEHNVLIVAKHVYVMTVHDFACNIDIAIGDAVDDMDEEQSTVQ